MCVYLTFDRLLEIQQLVCALLQRQPVTVHQLMSFFCKATFVPMDMHSLACCTMLFRVTCWCQHYYTLENPLSLGALGLNAFNHLLTYQVSYVFPPLSLSPLILSKFLTEHATGQLRLLILVAPCWMEAPWLPPFSTCLEDIPHWCPFIKDLIMVVSVEWVLKNLP